MLPTEIRPASPDDVPAIAALIHAAYKPYVQRIGREPAPMTVDYATVVEAGEAWVAERDGAMVGVLVLRSEPDHLLLDTIAVAPAAQRLGIGATMLDFAEGEARRRGHPEVRLYTNELMTENIAYYPRHGYRETHRASNAGFWRVYFTKPVRAHA